MEKAQRYNVVFLIDKNPPTKVILLKRAATKSYAPNYYTGIGGHIGDMPGLENETPLDSAYRELNEETEGTINRENITLNEFARCIYDVGDILYYFWGSYDKEEVPKFNKDDGSLEWVDTKDLLDKKIIPTTMAVCREWKNREFRLDKPFTIFVDKKGMDGTVRLITVSKVLNGLG